MQSPQRSAYMMAAFSNVLQKLQFFNINFYVNTFYINIFVVFVCKQSIVRINCYYNTVLL